MSPARSRRPLSGPAGRAARRRLGRAGRPVLFLDVDGTLAPIVPRPPAARVPPGTLAILRRLRARGARVVLVSGRTAADAHAVARGVAVDGVIGNHGAELRRGGRSRRWVGRGAARVASVARRLGPLVAAFPRTVLEDKGYSLAVHCRAGPEVFRALLRAVRGALHGTGLVAQGGKRVIDIRSPDAGKGAAVLRWLEDMERGRVPLEEVLYAGDDTTDEDAVRALGRQAVTISVGSRPAGARFRTRGPATLARWLQALARERG